MTTYNPAAAANFSSHPLTDSSERYHRADGFIDAAIKLCEIWDKDALMADANSGFFADPIKVNKINHLGKYFNVAWALNIPRSI